MIKLIESTKYWGSDNFPNVLKKEIVKLGADNLPLQKAAIPGSFIKDADIGVTVLSICDDEINIKIRRNDNWPLECPLRLTWRSSGQKMKSQFLQSKNMRLHFSSLSLEVITQGKYVRTPTF